MDLGEETLDFKQEIIDPEYDHASLHQVTLIKIENGLESDAEINDVIGSLSYSVQNDLAATCEPADPMSTQTDLHSTSTRISDEKIKRKLSGEQISKGTKCEICQDKADQISYGIYSCNGCAGFFRRTVLKNETYDCHGNQQCEIQRKKKSKCNFCRYMKCLNMGMNRQAVLDEQVPTRNSRKRTSGAKGKDSQAEILESEEKRRKINTTPAKMKKKGEKKRYMKRTSRAKGKDGQDEILESEEKRLKLNTTDAKIKKKEEKKRGKKRYMKRCPLCHLEFTTEWGYNKHRVEIHGEERPHKCVDCGASFMKKVHLREHLVSHLRREISNKTVKVEFAPDLDPCEKQVSCRFCREVFTDATACRQHELEHTDLGQFKCDICGKDNSSQSSLKRHMREVHPPQVSCENCEMQFKNKFWLLKHQVEVHDSSYPFTCSICGQGFLRSKILKKHEKLHIDANAFTKLCTECGASLSSEYSLTKHMCEVHGKEYPFSCYVCNRGFIKRMRLIEHMVQHPGVEWPAYLTTDPASVQSAVTRAASRSTLDKGVWEGTLNFAKRLFCPICEVLFSDTDDMIKHVREVHNFDASQTNSVILDGDLEKSLSSSENDIVMKNDSTKMHNPQNQHPPIKLKGSKSAQIGWSKSECDNGLKELAAYGDCADSDVTKERSDTDVTKERSGSIDEINKQCIDVSHTTRSNARQESSRFNNTKDDNAILESQNVAKRVGTAINSTTNDTILLQSQNEIEQNFVEPANTEKHGEVDQSQNVTEGTPIAALDRWLKYAHRKSVTCHLCGWMSANKSSLKRHILRHKQNCKQTYFCTQCYKRYGSKKELELHTMRKHKQEDERPYLCNICAKTFASMGELDSHLKRHDKMPFTNDMHPKPKKPIEALTAKPTERICTFECLVCHKLYQSRHALNGHCKKSHGKQLFKIERELNGYEEKARPFICLLCGTKYTCRRSLRFHCKMKHGSSLADIEASSKIKGPSEKSNNEIQNNKPKEIDDLESEATGDLESEENSDLEYEETDDLENTQTSILQNENCPNQTERSILEGEDSLSSRSADQRNDNISEDGNSISSDDTLNQSDFIDLYLNASKESATTITDNKTSGDVTNKNDVTKYNDATKKNKIKADFMHVDTSNEESITLNESELVQYSEPDLRVTCLESLPGNINSLTTCRCPICDQGYAYRDSLTSHCKRVHGKALVEIEQGIGGVNKKERSCVCPLCGQGYACRRSLRRHCDTKHGKTLIDIEQDVSGVNRVDVNKKERNCVCPVCGQSYTCRRSLRRHCDTKHGRKLADIENSCDTKQSSGNMTRNHVTAENSNNHLKSDIKSSINQEQGFEKTSFDPSESKMNASSNDEAEKTDLSVDNSDSDISNCDVTNEDDTTHCDVTSGYEESSTGESEGNSSWEIEKSTTGNPFKIVLHKEKTSTNVDTTKLKTVNKETEKENKKNNILNLSKVKTIRQDVKIDIMPPESMAKIQSVFKSITNSKATMYDLTKMDQNKENDFLVTSDLCNYDVIARKLNSSVDECAESASDGEVVGSNPDEVSHAGEQMYQCNHCAFQTTDESSIGSHLTIAHGSDSAQHYTTIATHYGQDGNAVMRVNSTTPMELTDSTDEETFDGPFI